MRAGLSRGLLDKAEVIAWADKIVQKESEPDLFFIDLSMSGSGKLQNLLQVFNEYFNYEDGKIEGRPLIGLIGKKYYQGSMSMADVVRSLCYLKSETSLNPMEISAIYSIDVNYEAAEYSSYGSLPKVKEEIDWFLSVYEDYTIDKFERWNEVDARVDIILDKEKQRLERLMRQNEIPKSAGKKQ